MWLAVLVGIALVVFGAIQMGLVPPPGANVLLRIRNGEPRVVRGSLHPHVTDHIAEVLSSENVMRGWIAILPNSRTVCSRAIPPAARQRVRNVLVNQWVD